MAGRHLLGGDGDGAALLYADHGHWHRLTEELVGSEELCGHPQERLGTWNKKVFAIC